MTDQHDQQNNGSEANSASDETLSKETQSEQNPIEILEAKIKESDQRFLYLYAEFENYKKRAVKERADTMKFGWEGVARDLLSTIDNLERALEHAPEGLDKNFHDGLKMVHSDFISTLKRRGVEVDESLGKAFDPNFHEAVGQDTDATKPSGCVLKIQQNGYLMHGRLLRPAQVIVNVTK